MSVDGASKTLVSQRPLTRRILDGASWALLSKTLTYPAGLILIMLLARLLSPEAMGGYFLATSMVAFAVALVQVGMGRTLVKLIAKALAKSSHMMVRQVVRVGIISVLVSASLVAVSLVAGLGDWLLDMLDGGEYLRLSLLWMVLLILSMAMVELFAEILRGFHDLRGTSLLIDQVLQRVILVVVLSVIWLSGLQLELDEVLKYSFLSALFAAVIGAFMIRANLATLDSDGGRMKLIDIYKLAPPFLVIRVNFWLLNMAGIWVLGMFRPLEEVALYGAANIMSSLVLAPQTIMSGVGAPVIVELFHKQSMGLLGNIIRTAGFFALLPALALSTVLVLFGSDVLVWVYGIDYQQAATVMSVLAVGRCAAVFCGVPTVILAMTDYHNTVMKVMTLMSVLTFAGYFIVADQVGALGIAVVTAVSIAIQNLVMVYLVRKRFNLITFPTFTPTVWQGFLRELLKYKRSS